MIPRLYKENLVAAMVVMAVAFTLEWRFPREIGLCRVLPQDRLTYYAEDQSIMPLVRHVMTFWLVRGLLTCQLLYALAIAPDWRPVGVVFFSVFMLYFPVVQFVEHLKVNWTTDNECSARDQGNGISGHTFFYTWVLSSVHFLMYYIRNIKLMNRGHLSRKVILLVDFMAFVLIFPSMVITYWHGHHSLKQMFFGAAIGALWNAVLFFSLSKIEFLKFPVEAPRKVRSKSL